MKKKSLLILLASLAAIVFLLADAFVPYLLHSHRKRSTEEILQLFDNETPISELLTKKYNFKEKRKHKRFEFWHNLVCYYSDSLDDYFYFRIYQGTQYLGYIPLEELDKHMPVQCLRKADDEHYYAVYQDRSGALIYILFRWNKEKGVPNRESVYIIDTWLDIPKKRLYKRDFEGLQVGTSYLEDVKRIDPDVKLSGYNSWMMEISGHITFDGYYVRIGYDFKDDSIVKIEIEAMDEDFVQNWLLPQDKPE